MTWLRCLLRGHRRIVRWADQDGTAVMCCTCLLVRHNRKQPRVDGFYR